MKRRCAPSQVSKIVPDPRILSRRTARFKTPRIRPLAEELLFGRLAKGGIVRVTRKSEGDGLAFSFQERPVVPAPGEPELVQ